MKRYIVLLTALVISHFAMAQDFKPMEHNGLLYQELVFCNDVKGKIPLVIYLHGRHASGNDNQKQLSQAGVQRDRQIPTEERYSSLLSCSTMSRGLWVGRTERQFWLHRQSGEFDNLLSEDKRYWYEQDLYMRRIYGCMWHMENLEG